MNKDFKIMIGALAFTFLLIVGLSLIFGGGENEEPVTAGVKVEGLEADPEHYELDDVPINGGLVTKEYQVKNNSGGNMTLKKIATSCMCTKASVEIEGKKSRFFGMEMGMDKNPPINMELPDGVVAKVTVAFDPAAHGPQGIGPFDRSIWLTFSDPGGVKELTFSGTVVN